MVEILLCARAGPRCFRAARVAWVEGHSRRGEASLHIFADLCDKSGDVFLGTAGTAYEKRPGVPPRSLSTPVPTAALTPTLLDLVAGLQPEAESLPSLVPLMAGVVLPIDGAPFPIIMHDTLQDAIALDHRVFRFTPSENVTELFSLEDLDAANPENLLEREPATASHLSHVLVGNLSP